MLKEAIEKIIKSKSRAFLTLCFCFIVGVAIFSSNSQRNEWQFYLYLLVFIDLFLIIIFWHKLIIKFVLVGVLFFLVGGLRFYWSVPSFNESNIIYYNGHNVELIGKISQEITKKENSNQGILSVSTVSNKNVTGKVLLFLPPYTNFKYGDLVKVRCELQAPENSDSFINYDKYLARDGIWSLCGWPKIEKLSYRPNFLENIIKIFYNFKQSIQVLVNKLWIEPESSLMAGLLYGARSGFSAEVKNDFNRAGITHIVAISGYNISVVANVMMGMLLIVGLNRRRAFWWAIFGILLFVLFTGASASVMRAGIMGVLVLLASQMGRLSRIGNVLVFTAAVMLLFNPFVLIWDAGFQLSFLSTLGLIYLSPIINSYFVVDEKRIVLKNLVENFITTMSAIIATLPLILFQFGRLSLVAPLANLLIVWIVPYLMLIGFISIMLSVIFFPLAWLVAWVAYLGLKYVIIMAHYLSSWPLASINFTVPLWVMIILYSSIIFYIYKYGKD
jgi:competence protein ComEC